MPWWGPRRRQQQVISSERVETPPASIESTSPSHGQSLYERNWAYISPELQERLAKTILFTAGSGLGSVVAALAARTGVQRFIVADGDTVEESNLNRQAFTRAHLGQNKAEATSAIIKDIQPEAEVEIVDRYLDDSDCRALASRADIILNTIDLETLAFLELNRAARVAQKPVLFPLNPLWMGTLIVFTPESQSLDEFLDTEDVATSQVRLEDVTVRLMERIYAQVPGGMPEYVKSLISGYFGREAPPDTSEGAPGVQAMAGRGAPQLGVTTYLTAALTVRALVALVAHEPVRVAPQVITVDAFSQIAPPL